MLKLLTALSMLPTDVTLAHPTDFITNQSKTIEISELKQNLCTKNKDKNYLLYLFLNNTYIDSKRFNASTNELAIITILRTCLIISNRLTKEWIFIQIQDENIPWSDELRIKCKKMKEAESIDPNYTELQKNWDFIILASAPVAPNIALLVAHNLNTYQTIITADLFDIDESKFDFYTKIIREDEIKTMEDQIFVFDTKFFSNLFADKTKIEFFSLYKNDCNKNDYCAHSIFLINKKAEKNHFILINQSSLREISCNSESTVKNTIMDAKVDSLINCYKNHISKDLLEKYKNTKNRREETSVGYGIKKELTSNDDLIAYSTLKCISSNIECNNNKLIWPLLCQEHATSNHQKITSPGFYSSISNALISWKEHDFIIVSYDKTTENINFFIINLMNNTSELFKKAKQLYNPDNSVEFFIISEPQKNSALEQHLKKNWQNSPDNVAMIEQIQRKALTSAKNSSLQPDGFQLKEAMLELLELSLKVFCHAKKENIYKINLFDIKKPEYKYADVLIDKNKVMELKAQIPTVYVCTKQEPQHAKNQKNKKGKTSGEKKDTYTLTTLNYDGLQEEEINTYKAFLRSLCNGDEHDKMLAKEFVEMSMDFYDDVIELIATKIPTPEEELQFQKIDLNTQNIAKNKIRDYFGKKRKDGTVPFTY